MPLRLVKNAEGDRTESPLRDAEVERVIPLFRKGEAFTLDMWTEGVDPKNAKQVYDYLFSLHIPPTVGRLSIEELQALTAVIVAGAGF